MERRQSNRGKEFRQKGLECSHTNANPLSSLGAVCCSTVETIKKKTMKKKYCIIVIIIFICILFRACLFAHNPYSSHRTSHRTQHIRRQDAYQATLVSILKIFYIFFDCSFRVSKFIMATSNKSMFANNSHYTFTLSIPYCIFNQIIKFIKDSQYIYAKIIIHTIGVVNALQTNLFMCKQSNRFT